MSNQTWRGKAKPARPSEPDVDPALAAPPETAYKPGVVRPFESDTDFMPVNRIDPLVLNDLKKRGLEPAHLCSDEIFVRRVYLDTIGTLPEPSEVRRFLADPSVDKRSKLIDALMQRDEFADYWALKWCDLLRVKAEFPINLWPNAVQAYHRWIRDAVRANMPYDQFVRALLTSSGSNFRVAPVNFYRAIQGRDANGIAAAVALTFMGARFENWPADQREGMAAFFSRVAYKPTAEWKEEIVCLDPAATQTLKAQFPGGRSIRIPVGEDPRVVFADWLITDKNPWFSRAIANRVWFWLMGRGIIHEPDDIRDDNPPVNPELLAYLQEELVKSRYDLRRLFSLILNSRVYQQSSIPRGDAAQSEAHFACYPVRRLDAEVIIDALDWIGGTGENYNSPIPEPFTYIPEDHRTIALADGSISSPFLEMFGRPARDTGLESERNNIPTEAQRLHLLNSTEVRRRIEQSRRLRALYEMTKRNNNILVDGAYLNILSRFPTAEERSAAVEYITRSKQGQRQGFDDLVWALINSKEFLYRH